MTWPVDYDLGRINLQTPRVPVRDGQRQMATAREILARLSSQPGLVLADEVGMGKTFVALTVAVAAALSDKGGRPVVIMVPPSLRDKWPRDYAVFRDLCLSDEAAKRMRVESAHSGLEFFRLLDDPKSRQARLIFLTHGAFQVSLNDPWVKLAIIRAALHGLHIGERRQALPRYVASLVRTKSRFDSPELFEKLLGQECSRWKDTINDFAREQDTLSDDPVPEAIDRVLERDGADLSALRESLRELPARWSEYMDERLAVLRRKLNDALRSIWPRALAEARFRSPLLILDEAHHLKNPATRLASLFVEPDAKEESDMIAGALSGGFERMLFMTATPFQLGHAELLNILGRFKGIAWKTLPTMTPEVFDQRVIDLGQSLDVAQYSAMELDAKWRGVRWQDVGQESAAALDAWWEAASDGRLQSERLQIVMRSYERARNDLKQAEELLKPWVIRHLRARQLRNGAARRCRLDGRALTTEDEKETEGISIAEQAVLPFLLAARCQSLVAHSARTDGTPAHATFAEGLASSYEAFLETRRPDQERGAELDEQETPRVGASDARLERYLSRMQKALPSPEAFSGHPKISALTSRVADLWEKGEKVVVFCHFQKTGRALVRHVSSEIDRRLWRLVRERLACSEDEAREKIRLAGEAFDEGRPIRRRLDEFVDEALAAQRKLPGEEADEVRGKTQDVVRRFVRTPLFIGRYLDLSGGDRVRALDEALEKNDESGISLSAKIRGFIEFIATRCTPDERKEYLEALASISPGARGESPLDMSDIAGVSDLTLPNVRLANGPVKQETRRRLLLGFNSPFFPEVLIASSVMAEGVDLHLNCRYLIHHDLSWNPSTVEQRTGRVDRIGAKAERALKPICVFWPFLAGTQDEKMFRVVRDRERWFQVVMGEDYKTDELSTDRLADRVPLPEKAAAGLTFRLEVAGQAGDEA